MRFRRAERGLRTGDTAFELTVTDRIRVIIIVTKGGEVRTLLRVDGEVIGELPIASA